MFGKQWELSVRIQRNIIIISVISTFEEAEVWHASRRQPTATSPTKTLCWCGEQKRLWFFLFLTEKVNNFSKAEPTHSILIFNKALAWCKLHTAAWNLHPISSCRYQSWFASIFLSHYGILSAKSQTLCFRKPHTLHVYLHRQLALVIFAHPYTSLYICKHISISIRNILKCFYSIFLVAFSSILIYSSLLSLNCISVDCKLQLTTTAYSLQSKKVLGHKTVTVLFSPYVKNSLSQRTKTEPKTSENPTSL